MLRRTEARLRQTRSQFDQIMSEQTNRRPESQFMSPQDIEKRIQQNEKNEMQSIRERVYLKKILKKMQALIPLTNVSEKVHEQWQGNDDEDVSKIQLFSQQFHEMVNQMYPLMKILSIVQGCFMIVFLWMTSVSIVFDANQFKTGYIMVIFVQILNSTIKGIIIYRKQDLVQYLIKSKKKQIILPIAVMIGCVLMLVRMYTDYPFPFEIIVKILMGSLCFMLASSLSRYFTALKAYAQKRKMIKELRIAEMFAMLLLIAHIFGLILYYSSFLGEAGEKTWIQAKGLEGKSWYKIYIHSIYWAITTIVTVGYGDLTPQNQSEIIIVMIIQILGTSFFGYMINVIGITVDSINKKNQEYDNYQQTIQKLRDHYRLSNDLCRKMKDDIKTKYDQSKSTPLSKTQQIDLLQYVDTSVKKNFILETNMKIIKKSLFFLTYFTVNFQNQLAMKLIRAIYKKQDPVELYDAVTYEPNMIIINHGKISVYISKKKTSFNKQKQKLIKVIEVVEDQHKPNVYGYSSLILNSMIDLQAVADDMTSAYQLKRSDFLDCLNNNILDYESYHQMRQKMLLFPIKQSIQAPALIESQSHYNPNRYLLIHKKSKKNRQFRQKLYRATRRNYAMLHEKIKIVPTNKKFTIFIDQSAEQLSLPSQKVINQFESLLSIPSSQKNEEKDKSQLMDERIDDNQMRFDHVRIFEHFMRSHNINIVAVNYEKACQKKSYRKRIMSNILRNLKDE